MAMSAAKRKTLSLSDPGLRETNRQPDILREFNRKVDRLEQTGFWRRYETEAEHHHEMKDPTFESTGDARYHDPGTHRFVARRLRGGRNRRIRSDFPPVHARQRPHFAALTLKDPRKLT